MARASASSFAPADKDLRTRPDSAEASLAQGALQKGPRILELRYVDAPRLTGDYTLSVQIERIP